jgi:pyrroloquinoline quinone biosynthesis protein D
MPPPIADDARPRLAVGVRLQTDASSGKQVLLFPEGILELNETAGEILARCDGRTMREIVSALAQDYEADPTAISSDVLETIADLQGRKLLRL